MRALRPLLVAVLCLLAIAPAAHAGSGSLLSGYSGPGGGQQALLSGGLVGGGGGGSGGSGGGGSAGSGASPAPSLRQPSPPQQQPSQQQTQQPAASGPASSARTSSGAHERAHRSAGRTQRPAASPGTTTQVPPATLAPTPPTAVAAAPARQITSGSGDAGAPLGPGQIAAVLAGLAVLVAAGVLGRRLQPAPDPS